jgi:hypothetical protein
MALYKKEEAKLGGIIGKGFAFMKRTFRGIEYQGVFFSDEDENLEALLEQDEVRFKGVVYEKNRSGKVRKKMKTFVVDVRNLADVYLGERADFKVIAEV